MLVRLRRRFASAPLLLVGPVMCLVVGLAAGSAAALLKWLIGHMSEAAHSMMGVTHGNILLPVVGIVFSGMFQRYVLHRDIEHGSDRLKDARRPTNICCP